MDVSKSPRSSMEMNVTYTTAAANGSATTTPATATAALGWAATVRATSLTTACSALTVCLGLACKLDRDLAIEDGLAVEFADGTLGLRWSREIDEGVADGARGSWVDRDRDRLAGSVCELEFVCNIGRHGLHEELLEESLQLSLCGRVREVPNVQTPTYQAVRLLGCAAARQLLTLGGTRDDFGALSSVGGLSRGSGAFVGGRGGFDSGGHFGLSF